MKELNTSYLESQNKLYIHASELLIGMYVCELDKPWKDSSFIFQGFLVQNQEILQQVRDECLHVYIDVARQSKGLSANFSRQTITDKSSKTPTSQLQRPVSQLKRTAHRRSEVKKSSFFKVLSSQVKGKFTRVKNTRKLNDILTNKIKAKDIRPPANLNSFENEINNAQHAHLNASKVIKNYMASVIKGGVIDMNIASKAVQGCMQSVLRSPDAMMLMTHLKSKDSRTWFHSMNTCVLTITFGRYLSLNDEELELLGLCALMHDIGKLKIPKNILNKETRLNSDEIQLLQSHTTLGKELLTSGARAEGMIAGIINNTGDANLDSTSDSSKNTILTSCSPRLASIITDVAYSHHEQLDGGGYPRGLVSHQISSYSKMIAIVDAYDSLTSDQYNKPGAPHFTAINILLDKANSHYDETLVNCFIQAIGTYPAGSAVELNTGEIGLVIEVNQKQKLRPKIIVLADERKNQQAGRIIDLSKSALDKKGKQYSIKTIVRPDTLNFDISKYYKYGAIQKSMSAA